MRGGRALADSKGSAWTPLGTVGGLTKLEDSVAEPTTARLEGQARVCGSGFLLGVISLHLHGLVSPYCFEVQFPGI